MTRAARFHAWAADPGRPTLVALLEASQDRVFAICHEILRHRHDAEEAAQETLLEIVLGIEGVRDAVHYDRWLETVTFRTALDRKKSRRRRRERELQVAGRPPEVRAAYEGLHEAIGKLDEGDRDLILGRYFDRKTLEELGRSRGLSDVGVRKRIARAQERLKRILGCGVPGLFGPNALALGALAVKSKSAAAIAIILIPLVTLGTGVVAVSMRQSVKSGPATPRKPSMKIAAWLAEGEAARVLASKASVPPPVDVELVDSSQVRTRIHALFGRMGIVRRRSHECGQLAPESSTEEEGRALQREKVALDKEWNELYQGLCALAARDPATIVDLVRTAHDLPDRRSLVGVIVPEIDMEIESDPDQSGPLLSGVLALATGDVEDRIHFGRFAAQLRRGTRDLAKALLNLMNDPDQVVRLNAATSLGELTRVGPFRTFLTEQMSALENLALLDRGLGDHVTRGGALKALAHLRVDAADEFVLSRFETVQNQNDALSMITPMSYVAYRIAPRQETRLFAAMLRALEYPFQREIHYAIRGMAHHLSPARREEILRVFATRTPDPADGRIRHSYVEHSGGCGRGLTTAFQSADEVRY